MKKIFKKVIVFVVLAAACIIIFDKIKLIGA